MKHTGKTRITSLLLALLMLVSVLPQTAVPVFAQEEGAESEAMTGETAVSQVLLQSESEEQKPLAGKTIACVGDSITAAYGVTRDETDYVTLLAQRLGMNYIRLGDSGTTLCTDGSRICNIRRLTEDQLQGADVVTIAMGINDFCNAAGDYYKLGDINATDTSTIYGAARMWCQRIAELRKTDSLSNTRFYFVTPVITSWNNSVTSARDWDQSKKNVHGYTLRDLCNAIIEVAELYEVPVIDLNLLSGMYYVDAEDQNTAVFGGDGVHPGVKGHEMMANALANVLLQNNLRNDHEHTFGSWITTTWPTCTAGEQQRICSICSAAESRMAEPNDTHSYIPAVTPPTCTEQGYTTSTCTVCGDSYVGDEVDALGHSYGEWVELTAPVCDAEGKDRSTCTVCGENRYRDTRISGDSGKIMISDPVAEDFYQGKILMTIGDSLTNGTGVDSGERYHDLVAQELGMTTINSGTSGAVLCPGGHLPNKFGALMTAELLKQRKVDVVTIFLGVNDWDNGVVNGTYQGKLKYDESLTYYDLGEFGTDDTTTIYGAAKMWCERIRELQKTEGCEHIQFVFATPVITSYNKSVTTAKDWNQDKVNVFGYTLRQYCTAIMEVCSHYEIPVLDLNLYSGMYYHSEEDNNVDDFGGDGIHPGTKGHAMMAEAFVEFLREGYTYEARTVADCGHRYESTVTPPSCTAGGYTLYRCPACHYSYESDYTEAVNHTYEAAVTPPTCTEQGYTTYTCTVCGDGYVGDEADALGHDFTDYRPNGDGTLTGHCSRCGVPDTLPDPAIGCRINSIAVADEAGAPRNDIPAGVCQVTVSVTKVAMEGDFVLWLAAYTAQEQFVCMVPLAVEDLAEGETASLTAQLDNTAGLMGNLKAFCVESCEHPAPQGLEKAFLPQ